MKCPNCDNNLFVKAFVKSLIFGKKIKCGNCNVEIVSKQRKFLTIVIFVFWTVTGLALIYIYMKEPIAYFIAPIIYGLYCLSDTYLAKLEIVSE